MAGRGAQTFNKRQKEQQRKERQQEKFAKRLERKKAGPAASDESESGEMSINTMDPSEDAPEAAAPQPVLREPARDAEPR